MRPPTLRPWRTARYRRQRSPTMRLPPISRTYVKFNGSSRMSPLEPHLKLDYQAQALRLHEFRKQNSRPLTLSEKLLYSHLTERVGGWSLNDIQPGKTMLQLRPDRVACHDATATMVLLQFISARLSRVQVPTTIHCDHLIVAENGAESDIRRAVDEHQEVYSFLSSACRKYGIGFWQAGAGIIHTTIFESYAFPGGLIIGTDSHTPNAGGMAMLGIGVGGSDAVDAMSGMSWELVSPKVVGVYLTGSLQGWSSSKDIICKLAGTLSVSGGKGKIIEFFGPGTVTLGATAMATVCNMSAEIGSTSCIFPFSEAMCRYLEATRRSDIVSSARAFEETILTADIGSDSYYEDVIPINLSELEPHINGPFTPDLSHPISKFKQRVAQSSWPTKISSSLVGSCTNSSYEDLFKVQDLVRQARDAGLKKPKANFYITPGSDQIRATAEKAGILEDLRQAGALVLSNSCGPCVGQWERKDVDVAGTEKNSIISSFNRNFTGRHDSNPATHSFVASPEIATVFAYSGRLDFDPITDSLSADDSTGDSRAGFRFAAPASRELPDAFVPSEHKYLPPALTDTTDLIVEIDGKSNRLQLLEPFEPWEAGNAERMRILLKVKGKCTTDHISPAGPWYKYRGHLENISNNFLLGATNAFRFKTGSQMIGMAKDPSDDQVKPAAQAARNMQKQGLRWCIIGDSNYGEGSSREHAALEARHLGGTAIIAKSFARIHETNLKKQGVLPLTFIDPAGWNRINEGDTITLLGVEDGELQSGKQVTMRVETRDGETWTTRLNHSYHSHQIPWLRAGSALNHVKQTLFDDN